MNALITRSKVYPVPGTNPRFAWRWIYTVHFPPGRFEWTGADGIATGDTLSWAKRLAVANGFRPVEAWK